ncbi:hypothetical protein J6590_011111 [Homalodisca vitripennis]|nr:hypothetical protein J6590_011111 [Homalodisca vitripennis]
MREIQLLFNHLSEDAQTQVNATDPGLIESGESREMLSSNTAGSEMLAVVTRALYSHYVRSFSLISQTKKGPCHSCIITSDDLMMSCSPSLINVRGTLNH